MLPTLRSIFRLSPLLLVILVDTIGYSVVAPILAPVLFGDQPTMMAGHSVDVRYIVYGLAIGIYELVMLCVAPLLGEISDHSGRKPVLIFSMLGIVVSFVMIGVSFTANLVALLMLGRIVGGATAGSQAVAQAAAVDRSTPDTKAQVLSFCLFASSIGFILGPLLGAGMEDGSLVSWFDHATPLYAIAFLSLAALTLLMVTEPRPEQVAPIKLRDIDLAMGLKSIKAAFDHATVRDLVVTFTLMQIAWGAFFLFVPSVLINRFEFGSTPIATYMATLGVGFCLAYGVVLPLLSRKFGIKPIAAAGLWLTTGLLLVSILSYQPWVHWALAVPIATTVSVAYGAIITMMSNAVDEEQQGWVLGITISVTAFAWGFSSVVSGFLSDVSYLAPMIMALVALAASGIAIRGIGRDAGICGSIN